MRRKGLTIAYALDSNGGGSKPENPYEITGIPAGVSDQSGADSPAA